MAKEGSAVNGNITGDDIPISYHKYILKPTRHHYNMKKTLIYQLVQSIPSGRVVTYGQISAKLELKSPRLVGQILHRNPDPFRVPCYRVVFSDGSLAQQYAFGGAKAQKEKLIKEGIKFSGARVDLRLYGFRF